MVCSAEMDDFGLAVGFVPDVMPLYSTPCTGNKGTLNPL